MTGSRRRPRPTAALFALAASSPSRDAAAVVAAFRPPPSTSAAGGVLPRTRRGNGTRSARPPLTGWSGRGGGTGAGTGTSLGMVFDFFKKAQAEAEEQMSAFATGLARSRNQFLYNLEEVGTGGNLLDQLEDTLLQADLGLATTDDVLEEARFLREEGTEIFGKDEVRALLRGKLLEGLGADAGGSSGYRRAKVKADRSLGATAPGAGGRDGDGNGNGNGGDGDPDDGASAGENSFALRFAAEDDPRPVAAAKGSPPLTVHFVMGANGMGKTTTIGKLAHRLRTEAGKKVLLAACDTFRAGAVAQLERWGERAGVDCFSPSGTTNGPSAVLYGALEKALGGGYDVLLVDTSGRLSNNDALTAELVKMKGVIQKRMSAAFDEAIKPVPNLRVPHETLLVIDAAQGRMALDSAKQWDRALGLTGLVLTKLDGSAKGGSVVAVSRELGLPVKLVGVGEGMEDLRDFEPEPFVDALLGIGSAGGGASRDEGRALASRLTEMRRERSERARATTAAARKARNPPPSSGPAGQMTLQGLDDVGDEFFDPTSDGMDEEMQLITPGGGGGRKSNKARNKRKKKKKKKGKR